MNYIMDQILSLWSEVERPGIKQLIDYLQDSDFFTAPCSTKYHLAKPGGLAEHSWNVYNLLYEKAHLRYRLETPKESLIICGLGHDLCKVNYYTEGGEPCSEAQYNYLLSLWERNCPPLPVAEASHLLDDDLRVKRTISGAHATILIDWLKNRPHAPFPELPITYTVNDQLPLGHGEKSVSILQDFIHLTDVEKLAIRWHMGAWDMSDYSGKWSFSNANKITPFVALLTTADFEASSIVEREENVK